MCTPLQARPPPREDAHLPEREGPCGRGPLLASPVLSAGAAAACSSCATGRLGRPAVAARCAPRLPASRCRAAAAHHPREPRPAPFHALTPAPQVMWTHLEQRSFPMSEEEYDEKLDLVAMYLKCAARSTARTARPSSWHAPPAVPPALPTARPASWHALLAVVACSALPRCRPPLLVALGHAYGNVLRASWPPLCLACANTQPPPPACSSWGQAERVAAFLRQPARPRKGMPSKPIVGTAISIQASEGAGRSDREGGLGAVSCPLRPA